MFKIPNIEVVGLHFNVKTPEEKILISKSISKKVSLRREKGNIYDKNAIMVMYKDKKIGYISRSNAEILAPLMDSDKGIRCFAKVISIQKSPYRLSVNVSIFKKRSV